MGMSVAADADLSVCYAAACALRGRGTAGWPRKSLTGCPRSIRHLFPLLPPLYNNFAEPGNRMMVGRSQVNGRFREIVYSAQSAQRPPGAELSWSE